MKTITAYACDHCGKRYFSTSGCKKHEKVCYFDPAKKACASCDHLEFGNFTEGQRFCFKMVNIDSELKQNCPLHEHK